VLAKVVPRGGRVHKDAIRAACRRRHEDAHAEGAQPEVAVGDDAVVEVVDRRDPLERAAEWGGRAHRVHDVAAVAGCKPGKVLLLPADPLDAARRVDGHHHLLGTTAERTRRLPVDEQRHVQVVDRGKVRNRLPGGGLHAAGFSGNQEDQVQPHAQHQPATARS
jgi:hypothetical protein